MFRQLGFKQDIESILLGEQWTYLICPVHNGVAKHWSLCVIHRDSEQVYHYDSLNLASSQALLESRMKPLTDKKVYQVLNFPKQDNSYDAGVSMLCLYHQLVTNNMQKGLSTDEFSEVLSSNKSAYDTEKLGRKYLKNILNQIQHDKVLKFIKANSVVELKAETSERIIQTDDLIINSIVGFSKLSVPEPYQAVLNHEQLQEENNDLRDDGQDEGLSQLQELENLVDDGKSEEEREEEQKNNQNAKQNEEIERQRQHKQEQDEELERQRQREQDQNEELEAQRKHKQDQDQELEAQNQLEQKQDNIEELDDSDLDQLCAPEPKEDHKIQAEDSSSEEEWNRGPTKNAPTTYKAPQNDPYDEIEEERIVTTKSPVRPKVTHQSLPITTNVEYQKKHVDIDDQADEYHEEALRTPVRSSEQSRHHNRNSDKSKRNKYKGRKTYNKTRIIANENEEPGN
jgi:hypothetical protein